MPSLHHFVHLVRFCTILLTCTLSYNSQKLALPFKSPPHLSASPNRTHPPSISALSIARRLASPAPPPAMAPLGPRPFDHSPHSLPYGAAATAEDCLARQTRRIPFTTRCQPHRTPKSGPGQPPPRQPLNFRFPIRHQSPHGPPRPRTTYSLYTGYGSPILVLKPPPTRSTIRM